MTEVSEFPDPHNVIPDRGEELSLPQVRVLRALAAASGPLTRMKLTTRIGFETDSAAGRAVGYSDPIKRAKFERSQYGGYRKSLLSLGYVRELTLDIDGLKEVVVELTPAGRLALVRHKDVKLPPIRSSYRKADAE